MEMIPPIFKDTAASPISDLEPESKYPAAASMGSRLGSRLSVKRRLFTDETPENSPPTWSIKERLSQMFVEEKERALREWGFDVDSDSPSTSILSQCEWTTTKAADVPAYYRRGFSFNLDATYSPKKKVRFNPPLPASSSGVLPKPERSQISASITNSASAVDSASTTACKSISESGASSINETPIRAEKKKSNAKRAPISRQARLTDFYSQKRRDSAGASPMTSRKRFAVDASDSTHAQTSNTVLP